MCQISYETARDSVETVESNLIYHENAALTKARSSKQVSHIEVEQELVTLPPVKTATAGATEPHPFQLLLVPSSATANAGAAVASRLAGAHRRPTANETARLSVSSQQQASKASGADNHLESCSTAKAGTVSVGVAVQVPASSYVPAKAAPRRPQPPPVPPRNIRLTLNYPNESTTGAGHLHKPMQRPYREPPLLEEADSVESKANDASSPVKAPAPPPPQQRSVQSKAVATAASSSSQDDEDSDVENSRSGLMACVSNANDTSMESLVQEETALLLPAASSGRGLIRTVVERDENTLI